MSLVVDDVTRSVNDDFKPAWWLPGPHAQTLWASLCRPWPRPGWHRQRVELADGDFLDLDWSQPASADASPLVLILHGLEGSSRSAYVRGLVRCLNRQNWQSVVMNFRGCSGQANRLRRSYHSGETQDLDQIVRWMRHHWPRRRIAVVGYSLGGNVLLKWLGERGNVAPIDTAVAACVPMQLEVCADRMAKGFSRLYMRRLVGALQRKVMRKFAHRSDGPEPALVSRCRDFWSFDDRITAPLHGFSGATEYYARSSSRQYLAQIRRRTLIVHAADDPFMTTSVLPRQQELPDGVTLELWPHGGHVGFVAGRGWFALSPHFWLEERIRRHLAHCFTDVAEG